MCLGHINVNNAESLLYKMVIAFCRRRWIFETFDLREGPLIVSTLTSGPCSVFITNLKPLRRSLRTSNRRVNISPFSAVDVRVLNHSARLSEFNNTVRSRTEIFWSYSLLWISMLPFLWGAEWCSNSFYGSGTFWEEPRYLYSTPPCNCGTPVFKPT